MSLSLVDIALRAASVALLLVLAVSLLRDVRQNVAGRLAVLFAIGSAAHAATMAVGVTPVISAWHAPLKDVAPDESNSLFIPMSSKVESDLIDYIPKWKQGMGSGAATREVLSHINALPLQMRKAFNDNPLISHNAMNRMTRDQDWTLKWGAPREDIQNARRIIGEGPGWVDRLEADLKAGAILPAAAVAILGATSRAKDELS